jgi:lipid II:glycine glycyltransferase (peptidoglycan interpeptide bridge formation enzyme)
LINDCIEVFSASTAGKNVDLPSKKDLEDILEILPDNIQIYVAYHNSKPQSSVIYFFDKLSYYAVYAGMVSYPVEGINHLLHWQAMLDAKCDGVRYYDFVGSRVNPVPGTKYAGLKRFKSHFGGEFVEGFLWKFPISKTKYYICCCLTKFFFLLKLKWYAGDIIDQELRQIKRYKKLVKV